MICNVCSGTGFKNLEQITEGELDAMGDNLLEAVPKWIAAQATESDVCVCDCCGDGEGWYGEPGHHYGRGDPIGRGGPYASNGGLCKCN